jgi:hypothetical protein
MELPLSRLGAAVVPTALPTLFRPLAGPCRRGWSSARSSRFPHRLHHSRAWLCIERLRRKNCSRQCRYPAACGPGESVDWHRCNSKHQCTKKVGTMHCENQVDYRVNSTNDAVETPTSMEPFLVMPHWAALAPQTREEQGSLPGRKEEVRDSSIENERRVRWQGASNTQHTVICEGPSASFRCDFLRRSAFPTRRTHTEELASLATAFPHQRSDSTWGGQVEGGAQCSANAGAVSFFCAPGDHAPAVLRPCPVVSPTPFRTNTLLANSKCRASVLVSAHGWSIVPTMMPPF